MPDVPQSKDFPAILAEIMAGKRELPNPAEIALSRGVSDIAAGGSLDGIPGIRSAKFPGQRLGSWARYFLNHTQGGAHDGTGYAMVWGTPGGKIFKFAICKHNKTGSRTREQEIRGWHPGRCSRCGLDLSVDSGD
jgi:hypothetical protein